MAHKNHSWPNSRLRPGITTTTIHLPSPIRGVLSGETVVRNVAQAEAKKDVQFGCYLVVDEAGRLTSYAEELQINRPNLGILLIVRELKCRRLQNLARWNGPPVTKKNGVRVTARGNFPQTKELFQQRAAQLGLGMDEAVAMLFRAELKECWLEKSLSSSGNRA